MMKLKAITTLSASALVLAALDRVDAQTQYPVLPWPPAYKGLINEYLASMDGYTNHWDIGGEDRERYVAYEGYGIAGKAGSVDFRDHGVPVDNQYLLSRIRFHLGYRDEWWSGYVEGQSSLADGDHRAAYADVPAIPNTTKTIGYGPESDTIDLHQGYATVGNTNVFPLTLKIGRQEMIYGEERLIGAFGWNNIGRSFDEAKLRWQNEYVTVDGFTGMPVVPRDGQFDMPNNEEWFSGVYATFTKIPKATLETYFLARNVSRNAIEFVSDPDFVQPTARDVYTIGGRLKSAPGQLNGFDYTIEGAYQFGDFCPTYNGPRITQDAYMVVLQGGYTFTDWWAKPRLGVEFDYGSGSGSTNGVSHGTFDNLYPTNHKFYGQMDLVSLQNIQDFGASIMLKPTPKLSLELLGNVFWLANTSDYFYSVNGAPRTTGGYGIHPGYNPFVGSEVTALAGYAIAKFAQVEAGYGHFFAGDYIAQSQAVNGGSRDADWVYLQTTLRF